MFQFCSYHAFPSSYSDIFENDAVMEDGSPEHVIEAIESICSGEVEDNVDIDEVIGYFAVQAFRYDQVIAAQNRAFYSADSSCLQ